MPATTTTTASGSVRNNIRISTRIAATEVQGGDLLPPSSPRFLLGLQGASSSAAVVKIRGCNRGGDRRCMDARAGTVAAIVNVLSQIHGDDIARVMLNDGFPRRRG
jgi:hypothetical protein